jgi:hypothetical protein
VHAAAVFIGAVASFGTAGVSAVVAASNGAADAAPWVQSGSAALAVAALVYVAKAFANGQLVARDVDHQEKTLVAANAQLAALLAQSLEREQRLYRLLASQLGVHEPRMVEGE